MHPLSHVHAHIHMLTQAHAVQTDTRMHAGICTQAHTYMLSFILTWLESWLPPEEERKSKEDRAIRVRLLPGDLSTGIILRLATEKAEPVGTGPG